VNGEDQGDGQEVYIRSPPNTDPIKDLTSPDLACNVKGGEAVPSFVPVAAGDTLTFEWFRVKRGDDIIDESHSGPIITYIAEYTEGNPTGPIWTKIDEEGFDASSGKWAVDNLIAAKGMKDFTVPEQLAPGQYLIRQEIIAHHESIKTFDEDPNNGAQFYPACVQVEVSGSGTAVPDQNFDFNTGYTYEDPGIKFNMYDDVDSYPIPGPEVWNAAGGGSGKSGAGAGGDKTASAEEPASTPADARRGLRFARRA
jgi:cellulase